MNEAREKARRIAFQQTFPVDARPQGWAEHFFDVGFDAGYDSRDAEVEALREVLREIHELTADGPAHYYATVKRLAKAALSSGTQGENDEK